MGEVCNAMTFWYLTTWNFIHLNQVDFGWLLKFPNTVFGEMLSNHMECINEYGPIVNIYKMVATVVRI